MRGLPKSIIKKYGVTKKAWRVYRAGKKGKKRRRNPGRSSNPRKRSVKRTARRRRRGGGGNNIQATAFKWIRIGALLAPGAMAAFEGNTMSEKISYVIAKYTGYESWNKRFNINQLIQGYGPFLAATLFTVGIPKLSGIIRRL